MESRHTRRTGVDPFEESQSAAITTSSMVCSSSVSADGDTLYFHLDDLISSSAKSSPPEMQEEPNEEDEEEPAVTWPTRTDTLCWHCAHGFETTPCAIPTGHRGSRMAWSVFGCFCSWGCVKRYMIERPNHEMNLRFVLLRQLAGSFGHRGRIAPNPPRSALQSFGGPLTIEQFRAHGTRGRVVDLVEEPFISFPLVLRNVDVGAAAAAAAPRAVASAGGVAGSSSSSSSSATPSTCPPARLQGLRRPKNPVVNTSVQPTMSRGMYAKYSERRRLASSKRKRESGDGASAAPNAASAPSSDSASPAAAIGGSVAAPAVGSRRSTRNTRSKRGTLAGFMKK